MFPLRDSVRSTSFPLVNLALVGVNGAAFVNQLAQGEGFEAFVVRWGLVPRRLFAAFAEPAALPHELLTGLTSMFLHGDLWHFLGNMWFLFIFGDNVEDRLGHGRYLLLYLACGAAAAVSQTALTPGSTMPMVGASGAIAGVLGAYAVLYPRASVLTFLPILFIPWLFEVPALVFLGLWFVGQVVSGLVGGGGVAWWAHIFGFLAGVFVAFRLPVRVPRRRRTVRYEQRR